MGNNSKPGLIKAPKAFYKEPQNVSAKADYYTNICNNMLADTHYVDIIPKIQIALGKIGDYKTSILEAFTRTEGKVSKREVDEISMKYDMDSLLSDIQTVGNNDPVNAASHFEKIGVCFRKRRGKIRGDIEIRYGQISGSLDLYVRKPEGTFAVLWLFTTDPHNQESWKPADFSCKSHGFIDGLTRGTTYYFKARVHLSKTGKKDWTQIVDILCL